jgi:hypothetical protein
MLCFGVECKKAQIVYVIYYTTWLILKLDSLKYIYEKPYLSSRIARWQMLLVEYNVVYMTRKAIKEV